jgi:hypothetical protein
MTEIAFPFGILSKIWQRLKRGVIQPILEESHCEYLIFRNKERWSFFGDIEYNINFVNATTSNEERPISWISVRSTEDKIWNNVKILLKAYSEHVCYEEVLYFSSIDSKINRKALQNIPLLYAKDHNNRIYTPFSDVKIEILCGETEEKTISKYRDNFMITYDDCLNGSFVNRWGKWYNTDKIERIKQEFRGRVFMHFYGPYGMPRRNLYAEKSRALSFLLNLSISCDKFLCHIFCSNFIINTITWTSIILKLKPIKDPTHPGGALKQ